jgi:preprotein translocase subunit SecD
VNSLLISASLRGSTETNIAISGSGSGATVKAAEADALYNMKQLQTILVTGSLPVKLTVVKTDTISAELGDEFIANSLFVGLLAFLVVTVTMMVRYRNPRISIPVVITLISEVVLTLGIAAIGSRFITVDLAAIAGILIAIGTGVDDQIVMADEALGRRGGDRTSWRERLKKAFFIIFTAYFTAVAAMVPLLFAGAGLVKGFAITSIIGVTIGVLVTRPAFAVIMEKLEEGRE